MKRVLSLLLAVTMSLSLTACGNNKAESDQTADGRTKLTLASFVLLPNIEEKIAEFNNTNEKYYVEVIDYSQYDTADDFSAGETKLNTDILGGNIPDMIELGKMPVEQYTNKGLLENLLPYIESDADFGKNSLVLGAERALSTDDGLYRIAPSFLLIGLYGLQSEIGDKTSWSFEEMKEFLDSRSDVKAPFINMSMENIVPTTINQFMNADGTADFNSPEFISLLSSLKEYNEKTSEYKEDKNQALLNKEGLLATMYIADISSFDENFKALNGDMNVIGQPTSIGSGNIADFQFSFGMFSDSKNKEGCWEFLRTFLVEEYQDKIVETGELPLLKSSFDKMLAASTATEEVKDKFTKIIDATTYSLAIDSFVFSSVREELPALYEGSKTAEVIAEEIQKKVTIYLSENR